MSSSSDGLMHLKKNSKTDVSVGFVPLQGTPTWRLHTWVRFSENLAYEISHRPDSWRGVLYIHLLLFPSFGTSCINWFEIFVFEGVIVKTENTNLQLDKIARESRYVYTVRSTSLVAKQVCFGQ